MGYYPAIKKEQTPDTHSLDKTPEKLSLQKPVPRHSWMTKNYGNREQISGCQGLRRGLEGK